MPTYLTDTAICLRVTDFSETSQIVALFTRTHGLLPLIAKGAKRSSKKNTMSGPLDLLTSGEVVFIAAKGAAELGTLAGWDLVNHRTALRTDLAALNAGMLATDITTTLVHPHDPHSDLFDELEATLQLVGTPQRPRALVAYAKAALTAAGYAPQFSACLACARPPATTPDALVRFSPRAGGILCTSAEKTCPIDGPMLTIPARIAIALDRLPAPTTLLTTASDRPADPAALLTAMHTLLAHIESITNKPIRTRYLLSSIFGIRLTPISSPTP
jgi:DNA repair protein RecO (recombination protein O)